MLMFTVAERRSAALDANNKGTSNQNEKVNVLRLVGRYRANPACLNYPAMTATFQGDMTVPSGGET